MSKNEVVEIQASREESNLTVVSQQNVDALKKQRELLREFVQSQLVEADFKTGGSGEGDYGVIPGTKKRCLLKPGAEKIQRLFQLGCRFTLVDKEIDRHANFAMFTYKAEIYSLRNPDIVIADCDGTVNSQEVKYKERNVWREVVDKKGVKTGRKEQLKEETPIYDVLNTLMKMAQKRAMLGATLLATGASEYFTQDMLDEDDLKIQTPVKKEVLKEESAPLIEPQSSEPPICCDKPMMLSKYPDKETGEIPWYCLKCKTKKPA